MGIVSCVREHLEVRIVSTECDELLTDGWNLVDEHINVPSAAMTCSFQMALFCFYVSRPINDSAIRKTTRWNGSRLSCNSRERCQEVVWAGISSNCSAFMFTTALRLLRNKAWATCACFFSRSLCLKLSAVDTLTTWWSSIIKYIFYHNRSCSHFQNAHQSTGSSHHTISSLALFFSCILFYSLFSAGAI